MKAYIIIFEIVITSVTQMRPFDLFQYLDTTQIENRSTGVFALSQDYQQQLKAKASQSRIMKWIAVP